jgi:phosphoglycolate phosphatase
LRERYGAGEVEPGNVLVEGDTVVNIQLTKNFGSEPCCCRYGYGDRGAFQELSADFVVDSSVEVMGVPD